jgi:hypothetical protein
MSVIQRISSTILAAIATVVGLLTAAAAAAASPAPFDNGDGLPGSVPLTPVTTPTTTIVDSGSPWWAFVLVAAAAVAVTLLASLVISRWRRRTPATQLAL